MTEKLKKNRQEEKILLIVAVLILCAVICRLISMYDIVDGALNYLSSLLRMMIYMGIIIAWGISVQVRVLSCPIRRYMLMVAGLLLFWFVIRSCKYFFLVGIPDLQYYCWYGYYIPIIIIPLMGIYLVSSLGKTEEYILPMPLKAMLIPGICFILLILTNNFHQMVFAFPMGTEVTDPLYVYRPFYFVCAGWIIAEVIVFIVLLLVRTRVPNKEKRILVPVIPIAAGILYAIGYITGNPVLFVITGDITAFLTLVILAVCESCIQSRLVPSNTKHRELLNASTIGAQIVDRAYNRCFASNNAKEFTKELMRRTEEGPVEIGNERLSGAPITGGHVLWVDDVSMIQEMLKKLRRNSSRLSKNNSLLKAEVELKEKQAKADEHRRIYDKITDEVEPQLKKLESLLEFSDNSVKMRENLGFVCVISSYIKRLGNLILLGEDSSFLMSRELEYCLKESMENLKFCGIAGSLSCRCEGIMPKDSALASYVFFEMMLEAAFPTMKAILVNLKVESESVEMTFSISCESSSIVPDRKFLARYNATAIVSRQEEDVHIAFVLPKAGDMK